MNTSQQCLYYPISLNVCSVKLRMNKQMFDFGNLFWICVIAGSAITIGIKLRSEIKNGV